MEATLEQGITYTYNTSKVDEKIVNTVEFIEKVIKENNYRVSGDIEEYTVLEWKNFSKKQLKKIQKYCYYIEKHPTLRRINSFFSLLSAHFSVKRVNVKISSKEEKIQIARKEWLKAREESERLLAAYKKEKGDFYKKQLVN
jgi:hypothetical protein